MSIRSILALFGFWLALIVPGGATAGTILVHGDSLSAAYGLAQDQGWVRLLARRLEREAPGWRVENTSMSGETTTGGLARLPAALEQHKPDIVILELGANDGLRGWSIDTMKRNIKSMIDLSRGKRARVLLIGMKLPPNYGMPFTEKFHKTYLDLAREAKVPLLPFMFDGFAERSEMFLPDGLHPAAQAQPLIADHVWKVLSPLVKR
jgi:acyl-CoA thioesterase-1